MQRSKEKVLRYPGFATCRIRSMSLSIRICFVLLGITFVAAEVVADYSIERKYGDVEITAQVWEPPLQIVDGSASAGRRYPQWLQAFIALESPQSVSIDEWANVVHDSSLATQDAYDRIRQGILDQGTQVNSILFALHYSGCGTEYVSVYSHPYPIPACLSAVTTTTWFVKVGNHWKTFTTPGKTNWLLPPEGDWTAENLIANYDANGVANADFTLHMQLPNKPLSTWADSPANKADAAPGIDTASPMAAGQNAGCHYAAWIAVILIILFPALTFVAYRLRKKR